MDTPTNSPSRGDAKDDEVKGLLRRLPVPAPLVSGSLSSDAVEIPSGSNPFPVKGDGCSSRNSSTSPPMAGDAMKLTTLCVGEVPSSAVPALAPVPAPAPAPAPVASKPAVSSPAALGKVGSSSGGGKVLPKEEVSADVLNMLKVSSFRDLFLEINISSLILFSFFVEI